MSSYGPPIERKRGGHVIATRSARVKLDSIIVDMAASDLVRIRKEGNGKITGAQLTLRLMTTADRRSIEGAVLAVKPRTAARLSLHRCEVSLVFQSLGKHDLLKLKHFVADLRWPCITQVGQGGLTQLLSSVTNGGITHSHVALRELVTSSICI